MHIIATTLLLCHSMTLPAQKYHSMTMDHELWSMCSNKIDIQYNC